MALCCLPMILSGQNVLDCDPNANLPITQGDVVFNYGGVSGAFSFKNRSSYSVGQPMVDVAVSQENTLQNGYWARFLLPPAPPQVAASQGDFPDRTLISWEIDPLSSESKDGFVITRDGAFLGDVDENVSQFLDFNVQAGEIYEYGVYGKNEFGAGNSGTTLGFVNPNGVVAGIVKSLSGNPIAGSIVRLTPTIGKSMLFDGVDDNLCVSYDSIIPTDMFTISAWVKIGATHDSDGIIDYGSSTDQNFWIKTTPSTAGKGVVIGVGDVSVAYEIEHEYTEDEDDWHHVASVYSSGSLLLYIDGHFVSSANAAISSKQSLLSIGSTSGQSGYFDGYIDDVRIFDRPLTGTEIILTTDISVSKNKEGLVGYWKFDEGMGSKTFDLSNNEMHAQINGAEFSDISADVTNSGITNVGGFYAIESINYSGQENFTATPSKIFYSNYALEFNKAYSSFAQMTSFDIPDSATIETIFYPFDNMNAQTIMSNGSSNFNLGIDNGNLTLTLNGDTQILGPAMKVYQHVALTFDASTGNVEYYNEGNLITTLSYASLLGDWSSEMWRLGTNSTEDGTFFTGLIDEVAFYKEISSQDDIQLHAAVNGSGGTDIANANLMSYFDLNEGEDDIIFDSGSAMTGEGSVANANFSIIARAQIESPHLFSPNARVVNMNPSNTAASGIDFTDESTVTVSGVVRFENSFCFQDSVEIYVNGAPAFPPIYSDASGKFVGDFEPGKSMILEPKYEDQLFSPSFYEVRKINRPISSVLFQNLTKRTIVGQVSGGDERLSIISDIDSVKVTLETTNGCYVKEVVLENVNGKFKFENLPAQNYTVAVTQHTNNIIKDQLDLLGGQMVNVTNVASDTVDFRYYSMPKVEVSPFDSTACDGGQVTTPSIDESGPNNGYKPYYKTIRMYEEYERGRTYLDHYDLEVVNGLNDEDALNFEVRDTNAFSLIYYAGSANIAGDFTKLLSVKATSSRGEEDVVEQSVIVLGEREREASFITTSPSMPIMILRDPPGDGSSATWEKGEAHCNTMSNGALSREGSEEGVELSLGLNLTTTTGIGFAVETEIDIEETGGVISTFSSSTEMASSMEWCKTTTQTISTSADDAIIGEDADLYYGAAVNYKFNANDVLWLDTEVCVFSSDSVTASVSPDGFATEFIYSGWQIQTSVISNLELNGHFEAADSWRRVLEYNRVAKSNARFDKNVTFDGLASYSESFFTEGSESIELSMEMEMSEEDYGSLGAEINGIGGSVTMSYTLGKESYATMGETETKSVEVSYTLEDDDPNDSYTLDVLDDPVFGTPVFRLKAGETMCPWIPGTLNREEIGLGFDRVTAVNIPSSQAAIFRMTLSNLGQTGNDAAVYIVGLKQGSNPDGAIVTMDGMSLINPISVQLQPGETKEFLISFEIGPDVNIFDFDNVSIFAASECQYDHALSVGYNLAAYFDYPDNNDGAARPVELDGVMEGVYNIVNLEKFYKAQKLSVSFLEPCSPINISIPNQDWVQTPAMGDNLFINLTEYINDDPDLELIRVQYRKVGGSGAWINITEVPKDSLVDSPVSKSLLWDMSLLADGPYEVRAITQCTSTALTPGISEVIRGRKETQPPEVFGTPSPGDGILSPGDEISVEYTKRIDCDQIFQADGIGANINLNNLALQDITLGGVLIDPTITCKDEKIFIVPNIANQFIENHTLRVTTNGIKDVYGNAAEQMSWEFYVNRSNLFWVGGDIDEVVQEGNELIVTREIRNQSGEVSNFELYGVPQWMEVFPITGTVAPGGSKLISFRFPADLVTTAYSQIINLSEQVGQSIPPSDGNEPLIVDLRVACLSPQWSVDASGYSFSMNFVLELDIEGVMSTDKLDEVGAFIDGELRGTASIEYNRDIDKYLVFLTVYSNQGAGETVEFQIWDASSCQLFANIIESFSYAADDLVGTPNVPQVIHTNGQILRKINIHPGWNWLSFNLDFPDASLNTILESLSNPSGSLIKDQTAFSAYSELGASWFGNLDSIKYSSMYQYNSEAYDSMFMVGYVVDASTPLPLVQGWNWISYLPQVGMSLNDALSSLEPLNGDIIKSQLKFAVYTAGVGWIGNLNNLSAPNGYLLKTSVADTLIYPDVANLVNIPSQSNKMMHSNSLMSMTSIDALLKEEMPYSYWEVDPTQYEYNMNMIAIVKGQNGLDILEQGDEVAALVGDEIRGSSKVTYIPELGVHMVFMTIYANTVGETVSYKFYDASESEELVLNELNGFVINDIIGLVDDPYPLTLSSPTSVHSDFNANTLEIGPNPFSNALFINFGSDRAETISVSINDTKGHQVHQIDFDAKIGKNLIEWKPTKTIPNGTYFITLKSAEDTQVRKVLFIK